MDWDVTDVKVTGERVIWVRFKDGLEGKVRFESTFFRGVFADLVEPALFSRVKVTDGVVTWPGELDLAPDAMHKEIRARGEWVIS